MVAIVSGSGLGLELASNSILGDLVPGGAAAQGRSGERAYVNVANGNLVLQDFDDHLVAHGPSVDVVRTYNSLGQFGQAIDENGDRWTMGLYRSVRCTGQFNTAGSAIVRVDRDASESTYTFDASRGLYVSTDGAGAYDTIALDGSNDELVWTDGATGLQERYDSKGSGQLLSVGDQNGNRTTYAYLSNGLLTSVTDSSGETTYLDYVGKLLKQVRTVVLGPRGPQTLTSVRYTYDDAKRLDSVTVDLTPDDNSVTDLLTYKTTYTYDAFSGGVQSIRESDGTSQSFTYVKVADEYRVASVSDGEGNTTRFTYDASNRRSTVTDPLGFVTVYDYDAKGQLTAVTGPATGGGRQVRTFGYDDAGNVTLTVDPQGRAVEMTYDANGNQVSRRDSAGNTVFRTFGSQPGALLTETVFATPDPNGVGPAQAGEPLTTRYVYDSLDRLRFAISPEGRVTETRYNGFGERIANLQYTAALYATGSLAVDAAPSEANMAAWVAGIDRSQCVRSDMTYDFRGQLASTTTWSSLDATGNGIADGSEAVTRQIMDQSGRLLSTINPDNSQTRVAYDGLGRVLSTIDSLGNVTLTQYDDARNQTLVRLANGLITSAHFDRAGRLVGVSKYDASMGLGETRYAYDADGRLRMTQDPTGVRHFMLYDEAGRKVADIDGDGSLVEYRYNGNDQVVRTIAYATAVDTGILVDAQGKPAEIALASIRPLQSTQDRSTLKVYDDANRLVKSVDEVGFVTELIYDGASRITSSIRYARPISAGYFGDAPTAAEIDPVGSDDDRVTRNFYDSDGLLRATMDGEGYLVEYRYDARGQLSEQISWANAVAVDARASGTLSNLIPLASAGDIHVRILYNLRGQEAARLDGEGYLTERVYARNGNLTQLVRYATPVRANFGTTLAALRPVRNRDDQASYYLYDSLNRLILATDAEGTQTAYAYDAVGNLVSKTTAANTDESRTLTSRYDAQGRLVGELSGEGSALLTGNQTQEQVDAIWQSYGSRYTCDAAGRRTSAIDANGNRTLFYYDADSRLSFTVNPLGEVEEHRYNTLNQLTGTIRYGTRIATAGLGGGLADAGFSTLVGAARIAGLDSQTSVTYYRNGAVSSSTDELGNVTDYLRDAFGDLTVRVRSGNVIQNVIETFAYDRRGLQSAAVADPDGLKLSPSTEYDAFGRAIRTVDGNGNVHATSYDRLGRVIASTDPQGGIRSASYDVIGRVLASTDATGHTTSYRYDADARSVVMTTAEGIVVVNLHNRNGQTQEIADGRGVSTQYHYDRNGNLVKTVSVPGRNQIETGASFDHANRLIDTVDANGNRVHYTYDAASRVLTRQLDPNGLNLTSSYRYDAKGQQIVSTDPNGTVTLTTFDLKGQVLSQTVDPTGLNLTTRYTHDALGNTLTVSSPGGAITEYVYDALGRRIEEHSDPAGLNITRRFGYDNDGNLRDVEDANGQVTRTIYDANDRLVYTVDAQGDVTENRYDLAGRVTGTTRYATAIEAAGLTSAPTVEQVRARLSAAPGRDAVENRIFDADGRLTLSVDGAGAVTRYAYDDSGNVIERISYANAIDPAAWETAAPTPDPARDRHVRTVYDALNRAIYTVDGIGAVVEQRYDSNGNVVERIAYAHAVAPESPATARAMAAAVGDATAVGKLRTGYQENSNVNSPQEMVRLTETVRHFESMQKVMQGYNDAYETAIRKLGEF